jgi:hypothetical protein
MIVAKSRKKMSKRSGGILFTMFLFVLLAASFAITFTFNATAGQVPRWVSELGIILAVIEIVREFKLLMKKTPENDDNLKVTTGFRWYYSLLAMGCYLCMLFVVGFTIITLIYLALMPYVLGYHKIKTTVIFSVIATAVLYVSFKYIFLVELPSGLFMTIL